MINALAGVYDWIYLGVSHAFPVFMAYILVRYTIVMYAGIPYRPTLWWGSSWAFNDELKKTGVVIPVVDETVDLFRSVLLRVLYEMRQRDEEMESDQRQRVARNAPYKAPTKSEREKYERYIQPIVKAFLNQDKLLGKVIVVLNGVETENTRELMALCRSLGVSAIHTPVGDKRNAVTLGSDWLRENYGITEHTVLMDSDTLAEQGALIEGLKPRVVWPWVGAVAGDQRILDRNRTRSTRFSDWMEDLRKKGTMRALGYWGDIGCVPGRMVIFATKVIESAIYPELAPEEFQARVRRWYWQLLAPFASRVSFNNQLVYGAKFKFSDDRFMTMWALLLGYQAVFQATSIVLTDAMEGWPRFRKQQLRWGRGSQGTTLATFAWLWWKRPFLAYIYSTDILTPYLLLAIFVNMGYNMFAGVGGYEVFRGTFMEPWYVLIPVGALGAILSIGLRQLPHLKEYPEDWLFLPQFVAILTFEMTWIRIWSMMTCCWETGWNTRKGSYTGGGNAWYWPVTRMAPAALGLALMYLSIWSALWLG